MSSSTFVDATEDKDDQLIIIVNPDGTITVDPETLQKLIANQHGGNLSVVRVGDNSTPDDSQEDGESDGGGPHVNLTVEGFYPEPSEILQPDGTDGNSEVVDPFSQMEPEHIAKLESVLQSEQAKEILGTNLVGDSSLNSVLDILEGKDEVSSSAVHNDHSYTSSVPAFQQAQPQTQTVQVKQPSLHRPLTRGGRSRGRGRGLMTRGGRGGTAVVHQLAVPSSTPANSQTPTKVVQASPQKTYVVTPSSHPRVIAQPIIADEETDTPKVVRRTILTKVSQPSPQKQQTLQSFLSTSPINAAAETGGTPTIVTSTPLVVQRKVPITRGGRGRGRGGGRGRRVNNVGGDDVSAALQAMELSSPQPQPPATPVGSPPKHHNSTPQSQPDSASEGAVKKKLTMPTVIIRKIGSKPEIVSTQGKGNKVRHYTEDNNPEQYAIVSSQQSEGNKAVKQVVIQKAAEQNTTSNRATAKELVRDEESSLKKKRDKKTVLSSPSAENLGPELFSTPDIIRRVSTDKVGDGPVQQTVTQVEPKVQVQPTHPPFKPVINCDMTPESLLDSIHAEVAAAKDDSRLIAEAILLDDLTNDDSQSLAYPGKEKQETVRSIRSSSHGQLLSPQSQEQNQKSHEAQNQRVRKLPPIELPTTRSATKKAAASQQPNSIQQQQPKNTNSTKERRHGAGNITEKRYSVESKKTTEREKKVPIKEDFVSDFEDEVETDEDSWNSEDDPDRLWCICKKPHNNRFMICCDGCEEWFHGKCVGITKALGQQMESKGIEWSCPNCVQAKAQNNKNVQETTKPSTTSSKLPSGQQ